ncbi:MAG: hypothetical protein CME43_01040 [Haliea sp.]|uniref:DUF2955 domain-containing protein n=1 Tax=Haliea sp. TaxID=1932666 RepID=UPI000C66077D|nr:DUF2955 domain-containing protein [Haliea sp.]MBM68049.1 hypothetical protein [Haliea sp.]|tara:strand:- start:8992 stop:10050 length:1059 start_codon:yes stop_codon:yes gene_type:complete
MRRAHTLPIAARRTFRLATSVGLSLALGYGSGLTIAYIAPLFAVMLGILPGPPPGPRKLLALLLFVMASLGIGVVLGPMLQYAAVSALLAILLGLFFSNRLALAHGQQAPATLVAMGLTVIPATSVLSQALASAVIAALVLGIASAVFTHWIAYLLFPEDPGDAPTPEKPPALAEANWLSLRATLIVLPAFILTLINPTLYVPLAVKSILLGRESTTVSLRYASRELLGSTALGGACAVLIWFCLQMAVNLWFFVGWVTLVSLLLGAPIYGVWRTRWPPTFWVNSLTTMIILLGASVADSEQGKDVFQAFAVRMTLFFAVTLYAVFAMSLLERLRTALAARRALRPKPEGVF